MSKPRPLMWNLPEKTTKQKSLENENRLGKEIGFDLQKGSGNQPWPGMKGDGKHPHFLFECKETKHKSIRIASRDVMKIYREARALGKDPALVMSAYSLPDPLPKDWVAVPANTFRWLLEQIQEV